MSDDQSPRHVPYDTVRTLQAFLACGSAAMNKHKTHSKKATTITLRQLYDMQSKNAYMCSSSTLAGMSPHTLINVHASLSEVLTLVIGGVGQFNRSDIRFRAVYSRPTFSGALSVHGTVIFSLV